MNPNSADRQARAPLDSTRRSHHHGVVSVVGPQPQPFKARLRALLVLASALTAGCGAGVSARVSGAEGRGALIVREVPDGFVVEAREGRDWDLRVPQDEEGRLIFLALAGSLADAGLSPGLVSREAGPGETTAALGEIAFEESLTADWRNGTFTGWEPSREIPTWARDISIAVRGPCPIRWEVRRFPGVRWVDEVLSDGRFVLERSDETKAWLGTEAGAELQPFGDLPNGGVGFEIRDNKALSRDASQLYSYLSGGRWSDRIILSGWTGRLEEFTVAGNGVVWASNRDDTRLRRLDSGSTEWVDAGDVSTKESILYADPDRNTLWISNLEDFAVRRRSLAASGAITRVPADLADVTGLIGIRQFAPTSVGLLGSMSGSGKVARLEADERWELFPIPDTVAGATSVLELKPGWLALVSTQEVYALRPAQGDRPALACPPQRIAFNRPVRAFSADGVLLVGFDRDAALLRPMGPQW